MMFNRWARKIWLIVHLDCEGSARLTSESFDRKLDWSEWTAMKLHRMLCAKSRRLNRQMVQLETALRHYAGQQAAPEDAPVLSDVSRQRIQRAIRQVQDEGLSSD